MSAFAPLLGEKRTSHIQRGSAHLNVVLSSLSRWFVSLLLRRRDLDELLGLLLKRVELLLSKFTRDRRYV
jgi:hypothetical protein